MLGTILKVESLDRKGKTLYEISFSDGKTYATFDGNIAAQAASLAGQQVEADVNAVQKGRYTNLYWNGAVPAVGQVDVAPAAGVITPKVEAANIPAKKDGPDEEYWAEKSKKASRGNALNALSRIYMGSGDALDITSFIRKARYLAHFVETNTVPGEEGQQAAPVATTPQAVAEQVPAVTVGVPAEVAPETQESSGDIAWS